MCFVYSFTVHRRRRHSTRGCDREPYHGPHCQPEESYHTDSPSPVYQQRSPLKPIAQEIPDTYTRDTNAPTSRRREFTHRIPSRKWSIEPNPSHTPYLRRKSSCRVLEDPPGHIALEYRAPRQQPPPMIRRVSPRAQSAAVPESEQQSPRAGSLFRESSVGKSSRATRPRRSSTAEQASLRRQGSAPARAVEIHNPRATDSQGRRETRKVRFRKEVDDVAESRTGKNVDGPKMKSYPRNSSLAGDVANGYDAIQGERSHPRRITARDTGSRTGGSGAGRLSEIPRRHTLSDAPRARPQIIQDGHRQISERGVRVFRDSRPRNHTAFEHMPGSPGYRRPRFDSGDETVHNSRSRRRPYWRWRWD